MPSCRGPCSHMLESSPLFDTNFITESYFCCGKAIPGLTHSLLAQQERNQTKPFPEAPSFPRAAAAIHLSLTFWWCSESHPRLSPAVPLQHMHPSAPAAPGGVLQERSIQLDRTAHRGAMIFLSHSITPNSCAPICTNRLLQPSAYSELISPSLDFIFFFLKEFKTQPLRLQEELMSHSSESSAAPISNAQRKSWEPTHGRKSSVHNRKAAGCASAPLNQ